MKNTRIVIIGCILAFISILFISCANSNSDRESKTFKELGEEFVLLLVDGKYSDAVKDFDFVMKIALPKKKLKISWENQTQELGKFIRISNIKESPHKQYIIVIVTTEFENGGLDVRVTYNPKKKISGLYYAPASTPKDFEKVSYINKDLFYEDKIEFGLDEWKLPGFLTIPKEGGPCPVLILVHGSGPNDADETLGPNKPFKDLAWGLSSKGIAVFRYDKRTYKYPDKLTENIHELTVMEETVDDVLEAIKYLEKEPKIDPGKIFVLGHSLGGSMIPRISENTDKTAGFIILAGATRPLEELMLEQMDYIAELDGKKDVSEKLQISQVKKQVEEINRIQDSGETENPRLILGGSNKYWIDMHNYNICKLAEKISVPVLVLQGERDYQVTMVDFNAWKECFKGKENTEFKSYPLLNHLFMQGEGKSSPEEYFKPNHVSEEVINDIINWIKKN